MRGLCLLNIFVNHVTLGVLHELSPSKLGFCDSADIFVFLAGISAFLAYGGASQGFDLGEARKRMWRRAAQLYLFNVGILAASFVILAASAAIAPMARPEFSPEAVASSTGWLTYLWHVLTFQQSIGFSMVLRLYVFLLLVGPIYVWLAARRYWYPARPGGAHLADRGPVRACRERQPDRRAAVDDLAAMEPGIRDRHQPGCRDPTARRTAVIAGVCAFPRSRSWWPALS